MANFVSVVPGGQQTNFIFPASSHKFQRIIEHADVIPAGTMSDNFDFTCYVPTGGASTNGHLTINHELTVGGVTGMDLAFNPLTRLWTKSNIQPFNFSAPAINGTSRNCSGGLTPWGNVITCEETTTTTDGNADGYYDLGWHVELNPATKTVVGKLWAMGNGPKENVVIHSNRRTAYFGNDANPGYLYKYVANAVDNLNAGTLYVYNGSKAGNGNWVVVPNATPAERNTTMTLCAGLGATVFNGIEDVEIGPDGKIYLAVKNENRVYRFTDSDPLTGTTVTNMETYAGDAAYNITHSGGTTLTAWGTGNDNLAFDAQGNLWVLQDGGNNYIWVVMNGHTQASPNVKLFGIAPAGSEPTGITFTPDYKYMFISFQHPNAANNVDVQTDAAGVNVGFDKDIAIIIALKEDLGLTPIQVTDSLGVASGGDDVEENNGTGAINATSTDIELIADGALQQTVGLRFNNVTVTPGAVIENAYLQFTTDEITTGAATVTIYGEKTASAAAYNTGAAFNVSSRQRTTDSITWTIPAWNTIGEAGAAQRSPDLKNIIREITSQPGWQPGNSVSFIIRGTGTRTAFAYDGNAANAARLVIQYRSQNVNNTGIGTDNPKSKLHIKDGDVYMESTGSGMIIKSPDGNCWRITVSNTGVISSVSVACPN